MAQPRRMGVEGSTQRKVLMDAAEAILCDEGYIGISARNVATRAGFTKQLLYYYFRTMDDLILALVRRINDRRLERFETALLSPEPLRALWALNTDPSGAALATELTAIASHREEVRAEIVTSAQQFRALQARTVSQLLSKNGEKASDSAAAIVMIAAALAKTVVSEAALGLTEGHAEALTVVERMLTQFSVPNG
jgi:TetR/AcrR family transcriptional regulator